MRGNHLFLRLFLNMAVCILPSLVNFAGTPGDPLLHGIYPGNISGKEETITRKDYLAYVDAVGKKAAWIYFSNEWATHPFFPSETAAWIRDQGAVPWIRLMLRTDNNPDTPERVFTLEHILRGDFDAQLRRWAQEAKTFESLVIVEYGTEMNGKWFSWNGVWNGGGTHEDYGDPRDPDGPERFRDAYRHIITLCREEGARNLLWVFHVNSDDAPKVAWNRFEKYFPGDAWIDWLALSVYGAQKPGERHAHSFRKQMDAAMPRLKRLAPGKPIVVAEFGCTAGNPRFPEGRWTSGALDDLLDGRWPDVIGFSWWNEGWQNDDDPAHDTNMRVQDNAALSALFHLKVGENPKVMDSFPLAVVTLMISPTAFPLYPQ